MKRYVRIEDNDLLDRRTGFKITVYYERRIGDHVYFNNDEDERVIHIDDIEEVG